MKNNELPFISVIMSVYNVDICYLKESIDSILGQTFSNFEFIIFDDGSNLKVKEILEEYKNKDERIIIITNRINQGLTYNLARGVSLSKGKYICRQDADDVSLPERFNSQVDIWKKTKI